MTNHREIIPSPLGNLIVEANSMGITKLQFLDNLEDASGITDAKQMETENEHINLLKIELDQFFKGQLQHFSVKIAAEGTAFQKSVWELLLKIPFGEKWSYKKQAAALGDVKKVRAVANANAKNPISIIVPCHRVIRSNGKLSGYSGGDWRKEKLLNIEQKKDLPI